MFSVWFSSYLCALPFLFGCPTRSLLSQYLFLGIGDYITSFFFYTFDSSWLSNKRLYFKLLASPSHALPVFPKQVVRLSLKRECKCHGVTGSCHLKTCWRSLAPFGVIGAELKRKYDQAVKVALVDKALQETASKKPVARRHKKLVYLDTSPNYCVRNLSVGSPGMLGRTCNSDDVNITKCRSLCSSCNLRPETEDLYKQVDCRCKFVWCCSIKCAKCTKKYTLTTCTRR